MFEVVILSLVQGVTEFIPISSSSHLILISEYVNFENQSLSIDVSLHIGSFLAVITYFYKDIINFTKNKDLFFKIIVSSLPVIIAGWFLVHTNFIENLRNIKIIGWTTIIFGLLLYISDKFGVHKKIESNFNIKSAVIIGLFQILALVPGVSRSGIIITGARFLKFDRIEAAKISFLLSIPALTAWSLYGFYELIKQNNSFLNIGAILTVLCSFIFSYLTIKFFLVYLKRFNLSFFVAYRVILGVVLLILVYL